MVSTPITSIFDAAKWFLTIGETTGEYISPLKLNSLLYLSQAYYAAAKPGMKLMPAYFIAHDLGPIDPNLYRAMECKHFNIYYEDIKGEALMLLKAVWKKYGKIKDNELLDLLKSQTPYKKSYSLKFPNNEIPLELMSAFYGKKKSEKAKKIEVNKKFVRTQFGDIEASKIKKWTLKKKEM